jgi:hypothetical protein
LQLLAVRELLHFTVWLTLASTVVTFLMSIVLVATRARWERERRTREQARRRLGPIAAGLLDTRDPAEAADALRPLVAGLSLGERLTGAAVAADSARAATPAQRETILQALRGAGIVELLEQATHRRAPWRRAFACQTLGALGSKWQVPVLVERLDDRQLEVRIAAVRALGELGSPVAAPALTAAFLTRQCAPSTILSDSLSRLGPNGTAAFVVGLEVADPVVRISSCYGIADTAAADPPAALRRLAEVLGGDRDAAVRSAAAAALELVGGDDAPAELLAAVEDGDVRVRRAAVQALGAFDDAAAVDPLLAMSDDEDRETAVRAADALLRLTRGPRGGDAARGAAAASTAWSVDYARTLAEVVG